MTNNTFLKFNKNILFIGILLFFVSFWVPSFDSQETCLALSVQQTYGEIGCSGFPFYWISSWNSSAEAFLLRGLLVDVLFAYLLAVIIHSLLERTSLYKLRNFLLIRNFVFALLMLVYLTLLVLVISSYLTKVTWVQNPKGWETYMSKASGFELMYPDFLVVQENGSGSVCFEDDVIEGPHEKDGFCVWSIGDSGYDDFFLEKKRQEYLAGNSYEFLIDKERAIYLWNDGMLDWPEHKFVFFMHRGRSFVVYGMDDSAFLEGKGYETFRFID